MSVIAPDDLITRTYLTEPDADTGEHFGAKIVKKVVSLEKGLEEHPSVYSSWLRTKVTAVLMR